MFENFLLCGEKKERAYFYCCWGFDLAWTPLIMAIFSILGIVLNWLGYEISNGFHSGGHYSTDYFWGASAFWVYFAAYVVYLTTKNL